MSRLMDQARAQQVSEAQRRRTALGTATAFGGRRRRRTARRCAIAAPSVRLTGNRAPPWPPETGAAAEEEVAVDAEAEARRKAKGKAPVTDEEPAADADDEEDEEEVRCRHLHVVFTACCLPRRSDGCCLA